MAHHFLCLVLAAVLTFLEMGCSEETRAFAPKGNPAQRAQGAKEATEYAAKGKLKLKEYPPLPSPPQHGIYVQLLRERHQIEYEVPQLPKGMAESLLIDYVRGWNAVMETEIEKKVGVGLLERLRTEAEEKWKEKVKDRAKEKNKPFT